MADETACQYLEKLKDDGPRTWWRCKLDGEETVTFGLIPGVCEMDDRGCSPLVTHLEAEVSRIRAEKERLQEKYNKLESGFWSVTGDRDGLKYESKVQREMIAGLRAERDQYLDDLHTMQREVDERDGLRLTVARLQAEVSCLRDENERHRAALVEEMARNRYTDQFVEWAGGDEGGPVCWDDVPDWRRDHFRKKARAARADKLEARLDELLDVALIKGDLPAIRATARKVHLELGDAAPEGGEEDGK